MVCAGVGTVGLVDGDAVERSNLHRQILHAPNRIGVPKVTSAAVALRVLAPECNIVEYNEFLTSANARSLVRLYDCILDCTDNPGERTASFFSSPLLIHNLFHSNEMPAL